MYIYVIYTPNLGLRVTVFDREMEQGRFKGSIEGGEPELVDSYPAIATQVVFDNVP